MALIFLTGMTGAGKTAVGEKLAARLGVPFIDLDTKVALATGRTIRQIFSDEGEGAFREQEALALRRVLRRPEGVVALGAGALERQTSFELVHAYGTLVYLRADIDYLTDHLQVAPRRPLFAGLKDRGELVSKLLELQSRREQHYTTAQIIVDRNASTSVEDTVEAICQALKRS